jgi:hypothetical protein
MSNSTITTVIVKGTEGVESMDWPEKLFLEKPCVVKQVMARQSARTLAEMIVFIVCLFLPRIPSAWRPGNGNMDIGITGSKIPPGARVLQADSTAKKSRPSNLGGFSGV